MKNSTEGINPFQQDIWDRLLIGGFNSIDRQLGKSQLNYYYGKNLCKEILLPMKPAPKYKFSRAKWYIADLWNSDHKMKEVREWCVCQFGPQDRNPDAWSRWTNNSNSLFRFRDEKDYIWFCLRWA